jgi:hypothetical protein
MPGVSSDVQQIILALLSLGAVATFIFGPAIAIAGVLNHIRGSGRLPSPNCKARSCLVRIVEYWPWQSEDSSILGKFVLQFPDDDALVQSFIRLNSSRELELNVVQAVGR